MENIEEQKTITKLAVIETKVDNLVSSFDKMDQKLNQSYLTKDEAALLKVEIVSLRQDFIAFRRIVVNIIAFLGVTVSGIIITAVLKLVVK